MDSCRPAPARAKTASLFSVDDDLASSAPARKSNFESLLAHISSPSAATRAQTASLFSDDDDFFTSYAPASEGPAPPVSKSQNLTVGDVPSIINTQNFDGDFSEKALDLIDLSENDKKLYKSDILMITALVIIYLENKKKDQFDIWNLIVRKARRFLKKEAEGKGKKLEEYLNKAAQIVQ
jgi:hypothetical protein